jgi:hypothetical protein
MSEGAILLLGVLGFFLLLLIFVGVGATVNMWWTSRQETRRAEREVAHKKDLLDRGLSIDEIERLLHASAEQPKQVAKIDDADTDVLGEFGGLLGVAEAKPDAIEEILGIVRAADSATKQAMLRAVKEMSDSSGEYITDEQIRAVVRALSRPSGPSTESATPLNDLPPLTGAASRISDAFRTPERPGV